MHTNPRYLNFYTIELQAPNVFLIILFTEKFELYNAIYIALNIFDEFFSLCDVEFSRLHLFFRENRYITSACRIDFKLKFDY